MRWYVERRGGESWAAIPPVRDLERWPRIPPLDRIEARKWGPNHCMYETSCYGAAGGCEYHDCVGCELSAVRDGLPDVHWTYSPNVLFGAARTTHTLIAGIGNFRQLAIIAPERGLPPDLSPMVARHVDFDTTIRLWTWLGLDEVLAFDWQKRRGLLTYRQLAQDFVDEIEQLVVPLIGDAYRELSSIANDAAELGHPEAAELCREARSLAAGIRLIFGFDSGEVGDPEL